MAKIEIKNLTFTYPGCELPALKDINLSISDGEFVVICGSSGSGKTTLLRHLKTVLTPHGNRQGQIIYDGKELCEIDDPVQASKIGYLFQNPENQVVTDRVDSEIAFGLENLGLNSNLIKLRVSQVSEFFNITPYFGSEISQLSGGQKQIVSLASVLAMGPETLVLDEPTALLDPISERILIDHLRHMSEELGITIIIAAHQLDELTGGAHRVLVMDNGRIAADAAPKDIAQKLSSSSHAPYPLPAPVQVYQALCARNNCPPCPTTVREARLWLSDLFNGKEINVRSVPVQDAVKSEYAADIKGIWFKYSKNSEDVLKEVDLKVPRGQICAVMGGNAAGKTTLLSCIMGIQKPYRGSIFLKGKAAMLPQDVQALFLKDTILLDLKDMTSDPTLLNEMMGLLELDKISHKHPYDVSAGEQQRAALAKVLLTRPDILLLDEPTKGMDTRFKAKLGEILIDLKTRGITIILASHDTQFCADYCDSCCLMFDGSVTKLQNSHEFFSSSIYYTTPARRMSQHLFENAVTAKEVIELCKRNLGG